MALRAVWLFCVVFFALPVILSAAHELKLIPSATLYDGNRRDICFHGDTILVASATGLEVFDVATLTAPCRVGQVIRTDGGHLVVRTAEGLALVTGSDSLLVFHSTSAHDLERIAAFPAQGAIRVMEYYQGYLYFADQVGWKRISFQVPQNPVLDFVQATPAGVGAFAFAGDSLFVARTDGMTLVYNVGRLPQLAGVFSSRSNISSLVIGQHLAYAAAGDSGVFLYDLQMESAEMEVGRFYTYGTTREVLLADTLLCIADSLRGLLVLGLTDPYRPFYLGANRDFADLQAIDSRGFTVAAAAANGVFIIDITDPVLPRVIGRRGKGYRVGDLAARKGILAAAVEGAGLSLIDLTRPAQPEIISEMPLVDKIYGLALAGDLVALACGDEGLLLVDIAQPASPDEIFRHATIGFALDVIVGDDLAVVADGAEGFRVFDITDPANARLIGGKSTRAPVTAVARRENYVYAVGPALGLEVYDISFAFKPRLVHSFAPEGRARDIFFADQRAFLSVDSVGILIFDIANPSSPFLVDRLEVVQHPRRVIGAGGLFFALDDSVGVVMIDYRAPGAAAVIFATRFSVPPVSAVYAGEVLYVSGDPYLFSLRIDPPVMPGDLDENGRVSLTDIVYFVNYLFRSGPVPLRPASADLNADGCLDLADLHCLIRLVFCD